MAEFNRGAFKATTMESLDSEKKKAQEAVPQTSYSGRAGFLEIKDVNPIVTGKHLVIS